jgi:hypothetical protein
MEAGNIGHTENARKQVTHTKLWLEKLSSGNLGFSTSAILNVGSLQPII